MNRNVKIFGDKYLGREGREPQADYFRNTDLTLTRSLRPGLEIRKGYSAFTLVLTKTAAQLKEG